MTRHLAIALGLCAALSACTAAATPQWPQFRGAGGSGVADGQSPPIHFGPGSNQLWKVPLPPGASSPCVWDGYIFLTAFNDGKLETLGLDRKDGGIRWRQTAPAREIEKFHRTEGSPASATPATDGKSVVSYFGSCGLVSYDFAGKEQWRLELPVTQQAGDFGSGASPIIAGGLVLMNRDQMQGAELIAVDLQSGKVQWRANRAELGSSYGTPVVWENGGVTEVILPGFTQMRAYDLKSGQEVWRLRGLPTAVCTTPVAGNGLLFFAGWSPGKESPMPSFDTLLQADQNGDGVLARSEANEMMQSFFASFDADRDDKLTRAEWQGFLDVLSRGENSLLAIKPGGKGDITETHVAWKQTRGLPYVPSPLLYRDKVYLVKDGGLVSCFNSRSGEPIYEQERIGAIGNYYASPVAANGRIYVASVNGVLSVLDAGEKPDLVGRADFRERLSATPAIVDNKLYIRTADHLWAFGK
ncbi:MAG: PQQ-binding-like beta-propeller repeat protein [Verrucomicrobia bacterium]|nr:PQQ-binding-like beta-propeller repeat protein [Verrucomicrobiota bacterium]